MSYKLTQRKRNARRAPLRLGATSVEFAFVAIPLFLLMLSAVELGRGMMVVQAMEEAARSGCRLATLKGRTAADAKAEIQGLMSLAGVNNYTAEILPADLRSAPQWSPVVVRVSANLSSLTWVPVPKYLGEKVYTASCVLPREGAPLQPD